MNCAEFQRDLNERFGAAGLPDVLEMPPHAGECASCHESWEQFRLLHEATRLWRQQTSRVDLTRAVLSALDATASGCEQDGPRLPATELPAAFRRDPMPAPQTAGIVARGPFRGGYGPRRAVLAGLAGIAALLAIGLAWQLLFRPPVAEQAAPENRIVAASFPDLDRRPAPDTDRQPDSPETIPYRDLAQRAVGAWGEATALVMPGKAERQPPSRGTADSADWIDGLQHQIRPIGRSLDHAFDFLWQAGESADRPRT